MNWSYNTVNYIFNDQTHRTVKNQPRPRIKTFDRQLMI